MRTTTYSYIQRYTYFSGKGFSRLYYRSNARLSCTQIHDRLESEPRSLNFARKHQLRDQGEQQVQWHGFGIKPFLKRVGVTNIIEFILTCRKNEQTQCEDAFALCDRLDLIGIELAEHLHNNFGNGRNDWKIRIPWGSNSLKPAVSGCNSLDFWSPGSFDSIESFAGAG